MACTVAASGVADSSAHSRIPRDGIATSSLERLTMFVVGDAEAARHGAYSVREVERAQRGSG